MVRLTLPRFSKHRTPESAEPDHLALLMESASEADQRIIDASMRHSMTGAARILALIDAVRHCEARDIPGAFIECGVWRGGSVLAMLMTLQQLGHESRDVYLYDTFEGMTEPTDYDTSHLERPALESWKEAQRENRVAWPEVFDSELVGQASVRRLLTQTGYPADRLHFVQGPVEETIPSCMPDEIALLRLDTDWYESTRHELLHLFPRLRPGGVLIIDDYGHWHGARRAVDEYFASAHPPLLLHRVDYTARVAIKG